MAQCLLPQLSASKSMSTSKSKSDDFTLKNGRKRVLFCPPGVNYEKAGEGAANKNSLSSLELTPVSLSKGFFGMSVCCTSSL